MNSKPKAADTDDEAMVQEFVIGFAKTPPKYFDEPQTGSSYHSGVWDHFHAIRKTETKSIVGDWFKCTIPGCLKPFVKCIVGKGNAKLRRHVDLHQKAKTYTLSSTALSQMLSAVSGLGAKYGEIGAEDFQRLLPPSSTENWTDFVKNVDQNCSQKTIPMDVSRTQGLEGPSLVSNKELTMLNHVESQEVPISLGSTSSKNANSIQVAINLSTDAMSRIDLRSKEYLHALPCPD